MNPVEAKVIRVVDGDTVWVALRVRTNWRSPELATAAGQRAKAALAKQFRKGTPVLLDVTWADGYGRLVAGIKPGKL